MPSAPEVLSGEPLVLGRHRLLVKLGQGGMGDVYLAASEGLGGLGRLDVIKRLRNTSDPEYVAMFLNEARIAKQLHHPNIVRTYEVVQEGEAYLLIMEYLHGPTLARLRRAAAQQGGVPLAIELEILCRVLDGLHHAHEQRAEDGRPLGLVHRDLSPENVIVTILGECKILDFGIAKALDSSVQTQAGFFKGKLRNVPPEQFRGQPVDRRADIFGAGVMLWEGISGMSLWGDLGNAAISLHLARGELPPIHQMAPHVPVELREICSQALASDPQHRFQTALAMRAAIEDYIAHNRLEITRSNLASFVEPLFRQERDHIDRLVRVQLTQSGQGPGFSGQWRAVPGADDAPTEVAMSTPAGAQRMGQPGHKKSWATPVAVLLVAALGGGAYLWWNGEKAPGFLTGTEPAAPLGATPAPPATTDDEETAAAYLTTAEELMREGAHEAAQTLLEKTAALPIENPTLLDRQSRLRTSLQAVVDLAEAKGHLDNQRWQAALAAAERALERTPDEPEAHGIVTRARTELEAAEPKAPVEPEDDRTDEPRARNDQGSRLALARRARNRAEANTRPLGESRAAERRVARTEPELLAPIVSVPARPKPETSPEPADAPATSPGPGSAPGEKRSSPRPSDAPAGGAAGKAAESKPASPPSARTPVSRPGDVAKPTLPRVHVPSDDADLRRMCARVEAEAIRVGGVRADFARGITEPLRRLVGSNAQIYPVAMYYFIVRESALGHDQARAAATLAAAQQSRLILRLKDLPANPM